MEKLRHAWRTDLQQGHGAAVQEQKTNFLVPGPVFHPVYPVEMKRQKLSFDKQFHENTSCARVSLVPKDTPWRGVRAWSPLTPSAHWGWVRRQLESQKVLGKHFLRPHIGLSALSYVLSLMLRNKMWKPSAWVLWNMPGSLINTLPQPYVLYHCGHTGYTLWKLYVKWGWVFEVEDDSDLYKGILFIKAILSVHQNACLILWWLLLFSILTEKLHWITGYWTGEKTTELSRVGRFLWVLEIRKVDSLGGVSDGWGQAKCQNPCLLSVGQVSF